MVFSEIGWREHRPTLRSWAPTCARPGHKHTEVSQTLEFPSGAQSLVSDLDPSKEKTLGWVCARTEIHPSLLHKDEGAYLPSLILPPAWPLPLWSLPWFCHPLPTRLAAPRHSGDCPQDPLPQDVSIVSGLWRAQHYAKSFIQASPQSCQMNQPVHFTDEETEAQKGEMTSPKQHT